MTLAQLFTVIILAVYPFLFAATFWFFRVGEQQRQVMLSFVPIAVRSVKDKPLAKEAQIELAVAFLVEVYKSGSLPLPSQQLLKRIIEVELDA
jgi:hypothetical protein